MSGEYFGRLIATDECGVCLLSSCKVRYPQNKKYFFKSLQKLTVYLQILDISCSLVLLYRELTY